MIGIAMMITKSVYSNKFVNRWNELQSVLSGLDNKRLGIFQYHTNGTDQMKYVETLIKHMKEGDCLRNKAYKLGASICMEFFALAKKTQRFSQQDIDNEYANLTGERVEEEKPVFNKTERSITKQEWRKLRSKYHPDKGGDIKLFNKNQQLGKELGYC